MIKKAAIQDLPIVAELACRLWPEHTPESLQLEMLQIIKKADAAFFLAFAGEVAVGFAQCQLRHDYVEGTEHSPVGYLEGIYVDERFRCRGIGKALLKACEEWAGAMGCKEFASDCELTNTQSQRFHAALGFQEANRIVCFVKQL